MHYSNLVIVRVEDGDDIDGAVSSMMGEAADWWDFWTIGGRWTGLFDGYNPDEDPANIKTCEICGGTGVRPGGKEQFGEDWFKWANGCNGCKGTGKCPVWPTQYKRHEGDIMPVEQLTPEHYEKFHRVVCEYGVFSTKEYLPWEEDIHDKFRKRDLPPLEWLKKEHAGCLAVVVDNHN